MQHKRRLLFRGLTLLVLIALGIVMYVTGRGHTVYFDNKTLEVEETAYPAVYRAEVFVRGEEVAQLGKRERGMATWIGQRFKMQLHVTEEKGQEPAVYDYTIQLPFGDDGIVLNLPALVAGLPQEQHMSIFVPQQPAVTEEEAPVIDELDVTTIEGG